MTNNAKKFPKNTVKMFRNVILHTPKNANQPITMAKSVQTFQKRPVDMKRSVARHIKTVARIFQNSNVPHLTPKNVKTSQNNSVPHHTVKNVKIFPSSSVTQATQNLV